MLLFIDLLHYLWNILHLEVPQSLSLSYHSPDPVKRLLACGNNLGWLQDESGALVIPAGTQLKAEAQWDFISSPHVIDGTARSCIDGLIDTPSGVFRTISLSNRIHCRLSDLLVVIEFRNTC